MSKSPLKPRTPLTKSEIMRRINQLETLRTRQLPQGYQIDFGKRIFRLDGDLLAEGFSAHTEYRCTVMQVGGIGKPMQPVFARARTWQEAAQKAVYEWTRTRLISHRKMYKDTRMVREE